MKIIHRTILKELVLALLVSLPVLNFILMMEKILKLSRFLSSVGAGPKEFFLIILYTQPELLLVTIPLGFLFSVLYTYGRMSADNELLVLRGSGMSFRQIIAPVALLGAACIILGFFVSFRLGPDGKRVLRTEVSRIIRERAAYAIEPGVFNSFISGTVIYAEGGSGRALKGIFIYDHRKKNQPVVIYASQGRIAPSGEEDAVSFDLKNGLIHMISDDRLTEIFFGNYHLVLPILGGEQTRQLAELTPCELMREARAMQGSDRVSRYIEFYKRFTYPLFTFAMIFFAPVLSLYSGKRARLGGLAIGTVVFTVYYMMLTYAEKLTAAGELDPVIGGWLPFVIITAASLYAFRVAEKK